MINISTSFRTLLLTGVVSMLVFPTLLITEATSAETVQITNWQRVKEIFRRKRRKPTSRPLRGICLITPEFPQSTTDNPSLIYNTKPFFLWKGKIKKIAVESNGNKQHLKTQIVTENQSVNYKGEPLQPGKKYTLSIFLSERKDANRAMFVPFKIMEASQRNRISAELRLLERLHKNKGKEAIAFSKAKYFAQKGLYSDALQQAYSVPNPSSELSQMIEDIPNHLCKKE